jgi:hypothetical protein
MQRLRVIKEHILIKKKIITTVRTVDNRICSFCSSLFVGISSLFMSKNFLSSVKVMILYFLTMIGITRSKNNTSNKRAPRLPANPAKNVKTDKARAKRMFQRLISVFKNDGETFLNLVSNSCCFVKSFIASLYYICITTYTFIVSQVSSVSKEFVRISVTFMLFLSMNSSVFASTSNTQKLDSLTVLSVAKLIRQTEAKYKIPKGLLASIAKVESNSHPFAVNIKGKAYFAQDLDKAKEYIVSNLAKGVTNIDIGVMQLNWRWHEKEFATLSQMLSPAHNIDYAGKLLADLKQKHGDWHTAVRYYHSATPEHHRKYSKRVVATWCEAA